DCEWQLANSGLSMVRVVLAPISPFNVENFTPRDRRHQNWHIVAHCLLEDVLYFLGNSHLVFEKADQRICVQHILARPTSLGGQLLLPRSFPCAFFETTFERGGFPRARLERTADFVQELRRNWGQHQPAIFLSPSSCCTFF